MMYAYYFFKTEYDQCPHCVETTVGPIMQYGLMRRQEKGKLPVPVIHDTFCTHCWPETFEWFKERAEQYTIKVDVRFGHGTVADYPDTIFNLYRYVRDKFPRVFYPKGYP